MQTLETLTFDNTYARLPEAFRQRVDPTPVPAPYLVGFNADAARLIDLDPAEARRPEFAEFFAGNRPLPGSEPVAMRYAGHQFGVFVPQLGDGRAILLGEVRNRRGEKWDLHLKGAGPTAFSRRGDGRAVLRSSIREYLCSEAMHGLGIPTTRALCVIGTELPVYREACEPGAMLLRMAPSHVRFGSFEVFYFRRQFDELRVLADYVIGQHYPELADRDDRVVRFFHEVVTRTADLMARWQAVGFAHGVMNTDNMSVLGLTLDYGPFGFVEEFDPGYVCNHSDDTGRYALDQQPGIGYWNLGRLGQALTPLAPAEALNEVLETYPATFRERMDARMREKLGLVGPWAEGDSALWLDVLELIANQRVDFTSFFRTLGDFDPRPDAENTPLRELFGCPAGFEAWAAAYRARLAKEPTTAAERKGRMDRVNPRYVLRNYLAQQAISAAEQRDFTEVDRLLDLLRDPFTDHPGMEGYARPAPDWGKRLVVSCSS